MKNRPLESFITNNSFIHRMNKRNVSFRIFIDSRDVIQMLNGIKNVVSYANKLNKHAYNSETTLVYSLIYGRWIEHLFITIPHQEEIHKHITEKKYLLGSVDNSEKEEFWTFVHEVTGLSEVDFQTPLSTKEYIDKLKPKSSQLYKANYFLRDLDWQKRLTKLVREKIVEFDEGSENLVEIIKSANFKKIHTGFEIVRKGREHSRNNLTDAIVLTLILHRLNLYRATNFSYLPLIFDSNGLFSNAIAAVKMEDEFKIEIEDAKFSIICGNDFMRYWALYQNQKKIEELFKEKALDHFSVYNDAFNSIISSNDSVRNFLADSDNKISQFMESRFLEICWINSDESIDQLVQELINFKVQKLRSDQSKALIRQEVSKIADEINDRITKFSIFKEIYDRISNAHEKLLKQFTKNLQKYQGRFGGLDVVNDFSLLRFSMPQVVIEIIRDIAKELLATDDDENKTHLIAEIVQNVLEGLRGDNKEKLMASLFIFWILDEYSLIIRILRRLGKDNYDHYSIALLHAAALAKRFGSEPMEIEQIENMLFEISNYSGKLNFRYNYKTAIGASYIYFQLWQKCFEKHFLAIYTEPINRNKSSRRLQKEALKHAKTALDWLSSNDRYMEVKSPWRKSKFYYILNNYIYYVTMGSPDSDFIEMHENVNLLENHKTQNSDLWQYRFSDTLALYYYRKAVINKAQRKKRDYNKNIREAKNYIKDALDWVLSVEDMNSYKRLSKEIYASRFEI